MNNNPQQAVIAVQEERARIGGIEVAKKTVIAATDEGVIAFQINTVEACGPPNPRPALPALYQPQPALPAPIVIESEPVGCCGCDDTYKWYDLEGKGICWILLLLLFYLVVGVILLPFIILGCICYCLGSMMGCANDD